MKLRAQKTKQALFLLLLLLGLAACEKKEDTGGSVEATIESYYPNSGNAGTLVTIEGQGFGTTISAYQATVGGATAELISATSNTLVLRIPEGGSTGKLEIKYNGKTFDVGTYTYQALSVVHIFPANGPAGSQIRVTGAGFGSTETPAEVYVNDKKALVVSVNDTLIVAEIPAESGTGAVMVKTGGKEAKGQNFTYQAIHKIKPLTGGAGTRVVISGEGFEELITGNVIDFNGKGAVVVQASADSLVVRAPDEVKTGPLSVNINNQKIPGPAFTVVGKPLVQSVTPLSGPKGAEMTIAGSLFSAVLDENSVYINDVKVPVRSATATSLKLTIPGGTGSGVVRIVVNDQSTNGPQFKDQNLGIRSMTPDNGLSGTTVTIEGTGFSSNAADNKVYFNGTLATVQSASENKLVLQAPVGMATGQVRVTVGSLEAVAPTEFRRAGVETLAGGPTKNVFSSNTNGIAVDQQGNVYVADTGNKQVKKITPSGTVSVLQAGGSDAVFNVPIGIVIDKQDNIYVSDQGTNQVIKITPSGQRSIYVSGFSAGKMTFDPAGNMYVTAGMNNGINRVNITGNYARVSGPSWVMGKPVIDEAGNLYYTDQQSNNGNGISRRTAAGVLNTGWAGNSDAGYQDGVGWQTAFSSIQSLIIDERTGKMYVLERMYSLREVDVATATVSTVFRSNSTGFADGSFANARFGVGMNDLAVDKDGNIYILDSGNMAVRKVFLR